MRKQIMSEFWRHNLMICNRQALLMKNVHRYGAADDLSAHENHKTQYCVMHCYSLLMSRESFRGAKVREILQANATRFLFKIHALSLMHACDA